VGVTNIILLNAEIGLETVMSNRKHLTYFRKTLPLPQNRKLTT